MFTYIGNRLTKSGKLEERLNYISENQEEKYNYTYNNFVAVLFNKLRYFIHYIKIYLSFNPMPSPNIAATSAR